ncbi:MAG: PadR family transcriptional regulator [Ilumatobacteraceae bacterium]
MRLYEPSLLDQIVLSLIAEQPRHGFAVSKELQQDPSLNEIIKIRRPLVYRSVNTLVAAGMIRESKIEPGDQGSPRTVYAATASGKRLNDEWLRSTVELPRDARLELLAKFALRNRRGLSNHSLAKRQCRKFQILANKLAAATTQASPDAQLVALWKIETVSAMIRLLQTVSGQIHR